MRKFIDGHGNDSSVAARNYLATHRELLLPELYVINPAPQFAVPRFHGTPGAKGPFPGQLGGGESAVMYSRARPVLDNSGNFHWVSNIVDIGTGYGTYGTGDMFQITISTLDANYKQTDVVVDVGTYGAEPPIGWLIADGGGGYFLGHYSGVGNWRWNHIVGGVLVALVGDLGILANCGSAGSLRIPHDACMVGATLYQIAQITGSVFRLSGIGPATTCSPSKTVLFGTGVDCAGVPIVGAGAGCSAINVLSIASVGDLMIGTATWAGMCAGAGGDIWILAENSTTTTLTRATGSGIVIEYTIHGGEASGMAHIEYCAIDNTLLYWYESTTLHKWDIASAMEIATAAITFEGSGPIAGGLLPVGLNLYDPVSLTLVDGSLNAYAGSLPGITVNNKEFRRWYDPLNNRIWVQEDHDLTANDSTVWAAQGPTSGVPQDVGLAKTFLLTDYPSSLVWDYRGQFFPATISRNEIESKIGLEAAELEVTWAPHDYDEVVPGKLTVLASFGFGIFDNATIEVWKVVMPRPGDQLSASPLVLAQLGDCNTFGATLIFQGRVGDVKPTRSGVKTMKLISRMETLNMNVPPNLIEPTNVYAAMSPGVVPAGGLSSLTVDAGSTTSTVYSQETVAADIYDGGYIVFSSGDLKGFHARILVEYPVGTSTAFDLSEPLPFPPTVGDTFIGFVSVPLDDAGAQYGGFRWVPSPDNSGMLI